MFTDKIKYKIVKSWAWLHIIVSFITSISTISMINVIPINIFFIMLLSDFIFFLIGYFILKYQKKAKEIMFFEYIIK